MKVLVFGGRDFTDEALMKRTFDAFFVTNGPMTCIIHGDAIGADKMGQHLARNWLMVPEIPFKPDWKNIDVPGAVVKQGKYGSYNAIAGHTRNQDMIDLGQPDWGMGFTGGTGTADMAKRLEKAGIPICNGGYQ